MSGPVVALSCLFAGLAVTLWPCRTRQVLPPAMARSRSRSAHRLSEWRRKRRVRRGGRRTDAPLGEVAATCDLIALALRSGAPVDATLSAVAECSDPSVARALRSIVAARRWGIDPVAARVGGRSWAPLLRALALADHAGVPPAGSMRAVAEDLRRRRRHRVEVATARLRVLVVLPLGLCFLPAFVLTTVIPVVLALAAGFAAP